VRVCDRACVCVCVCVCVWLQLSSDSDESALCGVVHKSTATHDMCVVSDEDDFVGLCYNSHLLVTILDDVRFYVCSKVDLQTVLF